SNDTANALVWLIITNGPAPAKAVTWKGNVNGNWDVGTANWLTNGIAAIYNQGDFASFDDTATTKTVNLTTALTPGNITNNTASTYTFGGTGGIAGTGGLDKQGAGTLIFTNSGNNNFGGGIAIESGTLQFGTGGTNGSLP